MDIIAKAREFAKEIQKTEEYAELVKARKLSDEDKDLQDQIGKFNLLKMNIDNEIASDNVNHDKLRELNTELQALYDDIMRNENLMAFNNAKSNVDKMLTKIDALLSASVNGDDVETFDVESACSGNCATCGGCN
jgi:cell fate (sporulation/competence/biofilm development) regulator YlbF (YheA/YmcA/DUF963 family)